MGAQMWHFRCFHTCVCYLLICTQALLLVPFSSRFPHWRHNHRLLWEGKEAVGRWLWWLFDDDDQNHFLITTTTGPFLLFFPFIFLSFLQDVGKQGKSLTRKIYQLYSAGRVSFDFAIYQVSWDIRRKWEPAVCIYFSGRPKRKSRILFSCPFLNDDEK